MHAPVTARIRSSFEAAKYEFEAARRQALLQEIVARFTGKPVSLLSYQEVAGSLRVVGRSERGRQIIPTAAIVGSVGRYNDFNREFLPRMAQDAERWARVKVAVTGVKGMPPIEVLQVGDAYFVVDGNHRVSIARQEGVDYLEAFVTEVRTRVPFSPTDSPETLIVKEEYADFLEYTRLDRRRPDADLTLSLPFQYGRLESLIEVHRYFVEEEEGQELPWAEAVARWYDEAYMPVVEAIREQGVLHRFPGRTETDLYLWLAFNRAALEHALDWEMDSEAAVARLGSSAHFAPDEWRSGLLSRLGHILRQTLRRMTEPAPAWAEGRMMARYSDSLFADLLLCWEPHSPDERLLDSALLFAGRERAHLHILHQGSEPDEEQIQQALADASRPVEERPYVSMSTVTGEVEGALAERAPLVDLVVVSRRQLQETGALSDVSWARAGRPLLIGFLPVDGPRELFLDLTGRADTRTAVFVATYLAERWQLPLLLLEAGVAPAERARIRAYLDLHEVEARAVNTLPPDTGEGSLFIRGMWIQRRLRRPRLDPVAAAQVQGTTGAVLLCP